MTKLPNQPEETLTELAKEIVGNLVFTSEQVHPKEMLGQVFMPVILGAFSKCSKEELEDIGLLYERYSEAGPGSINGYPIFHSFRVLNQHDAKYVWEKVDKIQKVLKEV